MKRTFTLMLAAILAVAFAVPALAELTPEQIVQKSLDREKGKTKEIKAEMVIAKGSSKRVRQFDRWVKEFPTGSKTLIRFTAPAQMRNTAFLSWENKKGDDSQWLFMASRRNTRRIASSDKTSYFLGSNLTNEDMGEQQASDRTHKIVGTPLVNGKQCWLIESVAKPGLNTGYHKSRSWIQQDNFVAVKIEMYNKKGKHIKTMECKEYKLIDGIWTMTKIFVQEPGKKGHTELNTLSIKYDVDISDGKFKKENLDKF